MASKQQPGVEPHIRELPAYREGRDAFCFGETQEECPYPIRSGENRTAWFCGWLDMKNARFDDLPFQSITRERLLLAG